MSSKVFFVTLTTAGKWSIVINHQLMSAYSLTAYNIKI
jgi:hypothetical protein